MATETFFSVAIWKNVVAKKQKKSVNKIFPSQRNTNQNFGLPYGKFWSPIFLLRIRTKRTRLRLGPQWRFIHLPLKNHDERIECRLYTQFHKTAKCFKSTLYLLFSLPFGQEMYPIEKLPVGSLLYVQNRKRSFLSRSVNGSPCCSHQATTVRISRPKNMAVKLRTARAVIDL